MLEFSITTFYVAGRGSKLPPAKTRSDLQSRSRSQSRSSAEADADRRAGTAVQVASGVVGKVEAA